MRLHRHSNATSARGRPAAVLLLVLCALLSAACGTRWDDEQTVAVAERYAPDGDGGRPGSGAGTRSGSGGAVRSGGSGAVGSGASAVGGGTTGGDGSGAAPTDPAQSGGGGAAGPAPAAAQDLPCRAPSDAPGVSDGQLVIGSINTLSGPVPGLGASFDASVRAYAAYRNAGGGVCGREVVVKGTDDGADNARNRALMEELSGSALAVVSGPAAGADGGAEVVEAKQIPVTGISIYERLMQAPTFYGVVPEVQGEVAIGKYRFLREQGITKVALVYIEQSANEAAYQKRLLKAAGLELVLDRSFASTTLSYDSLARAVANSGAQYLIFQHEAGASASMARSMANTQHDLQYSEYIIAYGSDFVELAGSAAERTMSWLFFLPEEDGGVVPEHKAFLEWMRRTAPGTDLDAFSSSGWAAAKVVLDSLEALGGPITREALLAHLGGIAEYDADGFRAPIELGAKRGKGCLIGMVVEGGKWKRLVPSEGFLC